MPARVGPLAVGVGLLRDLRPVRTFNEGKAARREHKSGKTDHVACIITEERPLSTREMYFNARLVLRGALLTTIFKRSVRSCPPAGRRPRPASRTASGAVAWGRHGTHAEFRVR